jgi:spore maturation protein CgeB
MPDLIIFTPVSAVIDPTKESIYRISHYLGIKVYAHLFDHDLQSGLKYEWLPQLKFLGVPYSFSECNDLNRHVKKFIHCHPVVNPLDFYDKHLPKDIDVCFWGSVPVDSKREEYIEFLRKNRIKVLTRNHTVPVEEYADILNRSKITLNFCRDDAGKTFLKGRVFEAMASGCLVLEDNGTETRKLFEVDRDFVMFQDKHELLEKINYYLEHEKERRLIAKSGCHKVTHLYNARNMWGHIFKKIGFGLPDDLWNDPTFLKYEEKLKDISHE